MEVPIQYLPWLRRSSLEIYVIVYLSFGLNPREWPKCPPDLIGEVEPLFRDIKAAIMRNELDAELHGGDVDWMANVLLTDFEAFADERAKSNPAYQRLVEFCQIWRVECREASETEKRSRKRRSDDDDEHARKLKRLKTLVKSECPNWPKTTISKSALARKLEPRGLFRYEVLKKILLGTHDRSNRLAAERDDVENWWAPDDTLPRRLSASARG